MLEDSLDQIAHTGAWRCSSRSQLLVDDDVIDARHPGTDVGVQDRRRTGVIERLMPGGHTRPVAVIGRRDRQPRIVISQPFPQLKAKLLFRQRVTESSTITDPMVDQDPTQTGPVIAERDDRLQCPAKIHMGQALPGIPDTTVNLITVSHTLRAARAQ